MATQRWALRAGLGVALLSLLPPVSEAAARLLSVHTLVHMLLIAGAAPLLAYGLAGQLEGAAPWLARVLGFPLTGLVAFNALLLFWQLPGPVDAMMRHGVLHYLAHLSLLGSAICLWYPVLRPLGAPSGLSLIGRVGYLLLAGVPPTVPGVVLVLARHSLYAAYSGPHAGLSALEDQQLAGVVLFGTAKLALVAGTLVAIWQLLTPKPPPPDDGREDESPPVDPPVAPAWLARLDEILPAEPAPLVRSGARDRPSVTVAGESGRARPDPGRGGPGPEFPQG